MWLYFSPHQKLLGPKFHVTDLVSGADNVFAVRQQKPVVDRAATKATKAGIQLSAQLKELAWLDSTQSAT